jgi:3-oxoacyl-(acyl-carrier-protein) synthase
MYDIVLAGGVEETNWVFALGFNALRALSTRNDDPTAASRPFDKDRDGFVISEGAGVIVLESESHAKSRGVEGKCVISGSSLTNTVTDMVVPDMDSSAKTMAQAIKNAGLEPRDIGYVNTHGTSTPVGDKVEMGALEKVFSGSRNVAINSTKSQTGHMIGATGTVEIIYSSLVLEKQFITPILNLENPEGNFMWADLVRNIRYDVGVKHAMSNSFGFGGANGTVIISKI